MTRIECERCGAELRLSLREMAYQCERDPAHYSIPRADAERRWIDERRVAAERDPADVLAALRLSSAYGRLGELSFAAGDTERAKGLFADELALLEALHSSHPSDHRVASALIESLGVQAQLAEQTGQNGTCMTVLQRILPLAQALHEAKPHDEDFARYLSSCSNGLGRMYRLLGDQAAAALHFEQDVAVMTERCARNPSDVELAADLAIAHFNAYLVSADPQAERAHLEQAARVLDDPQRQGRLSARGAEVLDRVNVMLSTMPASAEGTTSVPVNEESEQDRRQWLVQQVELELTRRRG